MSEFCDILKIAELFNPKKEDESDDDIDNTSVQALSPADVNKYCPVVSNDHDGDNKHNKKPTRDNWEVCDPEDEASFQIGNGDTASSDWKKCPQWDVSYRQQVTPSDVFLQMGGRTPSTSSCEDMIIKVHLPGENRQNIDLKITCDRLDLTSPKFLLGVPLPHPVDPQRGNAQWDTEAEKLVVTLRMRREFDYINF